MTIAAKISNFMENASWIRKMFEEGIKLKQQLGAENVFDFSLGNPVMEPPPELQRTLAEIARDTTPGLHRYMPNAGYPDVREAIARALTPECKVELTGNHIIMTCGAAGGLNIALKTILNPGDEVLMFTPYFVEYIFYADNHGGKAVPVPCGPGFLPDPESLARAITPRTRAVIINSPNNPTGAVYPRRTLEQIAAVLTERSAAIGHAIYLLSDDPYKKIVFDGAAVPHVFEFYDHSIYVTSHSKDLAVPGERIGFAAVHPRAADCKPLIEGMVFCNRVLGFVNAPALMQRVIKDLQTVTVNVDAYRQNRDLLYGELTRIGYEVTKPQGAFYMFPRSPLADEVEFCRILTAKQVLAVPGRGFGLPGYFRLSYCVPEATVRNSIQGFAEAFRAAAKR